MNTVLQHVVRRKGKNLLYGAAMLMVVVALMSCGGGGGGGGVLLPPTAPSAPTQVSALSADGTIVVGWKASSKATSYNLYVASSTGVTASNYSTLPEGTKHEGVSSPITLAGLSNGTPYYIVVTALNSAGESGASTETSGQPVHGNGDVGNYYPMTLGSTWNYSGTYSETGSAPQTYTMVSTFTGTTMMNGAVATVGTDTYSGVFDSETYYQVQDTNGVMGLGSNDGAPNELYPHWLFKFPLNSSPTPDPLVLLDKQGLNLGEDIDHDGKSEKFSLYATLSLEAGSSSVSVPAGSFTNCAKWRQNMTWTFTLSRDGSNWTANETYTIWVCQGVGVVQLIDTFEFNAAGFNSTDTMQLSSFTVN